MPLSAIVHAPHQFGIMIHTVRAGVAREKGGEWVNGNVGNRKEGRRTIVRSESPTHLPGHCVCAAHGEPGTRGREDGGHNGEMRATRKSRQSPGSAYGKGGGNELTVLFSLYRPPYVSSSIGSTVWRTASYTPCSSHTTRRAASLRLPPGVYSASLNTNARAYNLKAGGVKRE
jgi:hypothetical protein